MLLDDARLAAFMRITERWFEGETPTSEEIDAARAALNAVRRPTVRWTSHAPGVHFIDGVRFDCDSLALMAAQLAIASPGRDLVSAADFCAPGALRPENSVRNGLKQAAALIEPYSRDLAAAVRRVKVVRGFVRYDVSGLVDVVTGAAESAADAR